MSQDSSQAELLIGFLGLIDAVPYKVGTATHGDFFGAVT
jgi:hypothetical protein